MPSGQILYLMMFVGNLACTSHVLQYSSSLSYEHSRSLQSFLCSGAVTVLICSFFVAALLFVYINLKNGGKIIHIFTNRQTFSYLFCIFSQNNHFSSAHFSISPVIYGTMLIGNRNFCDKHFISHFLFESIADMLANL